MENHNNDIYRFSQAFLHYLDMMSTVKRDSVDVSLNFPAYSCFFFLFLFCFIETNL